MNNCPKCGNPLQAGMETCPICGTNIDIKKEEQPVVEQATVTEAVAAPAPVIEESATAPVVEQPTIVEETPVIETAPVTEIAPVEESTPVVEAVAPTQPVVEKTVAEQAQVAVQTPVAEQVPAPVVEQPSSPVAEVAPVEASVPAPTIEVAPTQPVVETPAAAPTPVAQAPVAEAVTSPVAHAVEQPTVPVTETIAAPVSAPVSAPVLEPTPKANPTEVVAPTVETVVESATPIPSIPASLSSANIEVEVPKKEEKPKKKKGINKKVVLAAVVLLLAMAGVGIYLNSNTGGPTISNGPVASSTVGVINNGYSFELQSGWNVTQNGENVLIHNNDGVVSIRLSVKTGQVADMDIDEQKTRIQENSRYSNVADEKITINDQEALLINCKYNSNYVQFYYLNNTSITEIVAAVIYQKEEHKSTYEESVKEFLSTVKYLEGDNKAITNSFDYSFMEDVDRIIFDEYSEFEEEDEDEDKIIEDEFEDEEETNEKEPTEEDNNTKEDEEE